ncbi:MAG: EamA family transporter [Myxococcota bacterium]
MSNFYIGIIAILLSSIIWALAIIFFRLSSEKLTNFAVNTGKNVVGFTAFSLTLLILGERFFPSIPPDHYSLLLISGFIGIGLGDLLFIRSLAILGAGLNSIVGCLYTPFLILGAVLFLGESISVLLIIGGILVIGGIVISSLDKIEYLPDKLWLGIFLGAMGMGLTVAGVIIIKHLLSQYNIFWINWIRFIGGLFFYLIYIGIVREKKALFRGLRNRHNLKVLFIGGFLGAYLAIIMWTLSLALLDASLVAVVNQLTVIVIIALAYFILKEPITFKKSTAVFLAISGAVLAVFS